MHVFRVREEAGVPKEKYVNSTQLSPNQDLSQLWGNSASSLGSEEIWDRSDGNTYSFTFITTVPLIMHTDMTFSLIWPTLVYLKLISVGTD